MPQDYILAFDLGTSALKIGLVSTDGQLIAAATEFISLSLQPGQGAEQDPREWWNAVLRGANRLLDRELVPRSRVVGIGCTAQWSGTVPLDQRGNPLGNAIIWMDARGAGEIRRITGGPLRVSGYGVDKLLSWIPRTAGIPGLAGKDSLAHILYLQRYQPELYNATYKFLEPKDYLNFMLTGRYAASFESITLHWVTDNRDLSRVRYDERLLALAGIDRDKLPELVPSSSMLGTLRPDVAQELGLSTDVQVTSGMPDVHSAAIGSGATRDREGHLYVGTSSWISCHVPFKKTDVFHNIATIPSAIPGRYLVANEQETAGACLSFLRDGLFYPEDGLTTGEAPEDAYELFDEVAASVEPGSAGVLFTPWLYGERTPVEDHSVRGGFHNISLDTSRPQLVRAVMEGVAYNSRWLLETVERFVGEHFDHLRFIGGGAQSELWCQLYADILDRTILQVQEPAQANVRGAALAALVALGYLRFEDLPDRVAVAREFTPNQEHRATYDRLYRTFRQIYRQNRSIYERLNG